MRKEIEATAKKARKLVSLKGGINSQERLNQRHKYEEELMKELTLYIPLLLKNEEFFKPLLPK